MHTKTKSFRTGIVLTSGLLLMGLLAGCTGGGTKEAAEGDANKAPEARLETKANKAWTNDTVTFDARDSKDPDGNITRWEFEFGDGSRHVALRSDDARVSHRYLTGGEYTVTLKVTDDGGEKAGTLTDSESVNLAVNERQMIPQQTAYAAPGNSSQQSKFSYPFTVERGADSFELELEFQSALPVASSEFIVKVIDPEQDVIDEETFTVTAGQTMDVDLEGMLDEQGNHRIEVTAKSGGAIYDGELRVFYDAGY